MTANVYYIRMLKDSELEEAIDLVWRVFLQFEAPEYGVDGILEFKSFIAPEAVREKIKNEGFLIWGCFLGDKITGVIASRPSCHISLLFVDPVYQRRGIARQLFDTLLDYYQNHGDCQKITVNSSPYAVEVYRKLGFSETDLEQTVNGIRFVPMRCKVK